MAKFCKWIINTKAAALHGGTPAETLADKKIWFGHQSVGNYIMHGPNNDDAAGMAKLFSDNPSYGMTVLHDPADIDDIPDGTFGDTHIGSNGNFGSKLTAFNTAVRTTFNGQLDIAILKPCWVDFDNYATIKTTSDADTFWTTYKSTMDSLISDFPSCIFVPCTVPVTPNNSDGYNSLKEYFSDKIRSEYASTMFDVADWESRNESGTLELYGGYRELNAAWDLGDGGHPNTAGSNMLALKLYTHLCGLI